MRLDGKVAVVTGSSIGLGAAIATALAGAGARVVVTGFPEARGRELAASLGHGSFYVAGDLRDLAAVRGLIDEAVDRCGGIDILVNNAAVSHRATLEEITPEHFDAIVQVNLRAPLFLAQAALPSLKARSGVIVNVGSVNAYVGWQNLLVYSSAKAALVTASRNLANALKYARVRVYCINPGWIDTEGERAMMKALGHPDDYLDRQGKEMPLGRLIAPSEVADVVLFLASDKAIAFSGTVLDLEQFPIGTLGHPKQTEPLQ